MVNSENTYESAKLNYNNKDYSSAEQICEKLWNNSNKSDSNLLSLYGYSLRKNNKASKFIKIAKNLINKNLLSNKFVISPLCWCLYDVYIKNYNAEDIEKFDVFLKNARFITDKIKQEAYSKKIFDESKFDREIINPYVLTVKKVVSIYNEKVKNKYSKKNYEEIINWLNKLNPLILSEECFEFEDKTGKERELASSKEFYYSNMTKALEKTENYDDCIKIVKIALKTIDKFHYRNKTWLELRLHYSKCMVSQNQEESISDFEKFANKKKIWFIWYKLSSICYKLGKLDKCLFFSCKAIVTEYKYENMVKLFYILGVLWNNTGDRIKAKEFFQAVAYYRYINTWVIFEELSYYISEYKIDVKNKPSIKNIIEICEEYINSKKLDNYKFGKIKRILKSKGYGFIEMKTLDKDIYFKISELKTDSNNVVGKKVRYILIKVNDGYIAKNIKEVS